MHPAWKKLSRIDKAMNHIPTSIFEMLIISFAPMNSGFPNYNPYIC